MSGWDLVDATVRLAQRWTLVGLATAGDGADADAVCSLGAASSEPQIAAQTRRWERVRRRQQRETVAASA